MFRVTLVLFHDWKWEVILNKFWHECMWKKYGTYRITATMVSDVVIIHMQIFLLQLEWKLKSLQTTQVSECHRSSYLRTCPCELTMLQFSINTRDDLWWCTCWYWIVTLSTHMGTPWSDHSHDTCVVCSYTSALNPIGIGDSNLMHTNYIPPTSTCNCGLFHICLAPWPSLGFPVTTTLT